MPWRFRSSSAKRWKVCHPMPGLANTSWISVGCTRTIGFCSLAETRAQVASITASRHQYGHLMGAPFCDTQLHRSSAARRCSPASASRDEVEDDGEDEVDGHQ